MAFEIIRCAAVASPKMELFHEFYVISLKKIILLKKTRLKIKQICITLESHDQRFHSNDVRFSIMVFVVVHFRQSRLY